ncbi:MAG: hypothetical protein M0T76_04790 [Desulfobacteraceae bacterium]|nr:hypothetical protein [Desulfobacteraceae bacterium]
MRKVIVFIIVTLFCCCITGCEKTGYRIKIDIKSLEYSDILQLETMLKKENFQLGSYRDEKGVSNIWRERKVGFPKYPGEVYTYLSRKLGEQKYAFVQVYFHYVKNSAPVVTHVEIRVENMYAGLIIPEIKTDIEKIGSLIYQELTSKVGVNNVEIERKEVSPPQFY